MCLGSPLWHIGVARSSGSCLAAGACFALVGSPPGCWRVCALVGLSPGCWRCWCARQVACLAAGAVVRSSGCCLAAGALVRFFGGGRAQVFEVRASHSQGSLLLRWCGLFVHSQETVEVVTALVPLLLALARVVLGVLAGRWSCAGTPALCAGVKWRPFAPFAQT